MRICLAYAFVALISVAARPQTKQGRELEDAVKKLDQQTKRRILALDAVGVPKHEIAEKIKYTTGKDVQKASRLVDAVKRENVREPVKTSTQNNPPKSNLNKFGNSNSNKNKKNK